MAGEYSVGSAFLQILPSFKGIAEKIEAEAAKWGQSAGAKFADTFNREVQRRTNNAPLGPSDSDSATQGTKSGGKFADGFKARVTAALKSLPDIEVDANTTDADFKLATIRQQLIELSGKRIGIDIDEATALAEVDRLKAELDELGAKSPSVRVQADTADAAAKLAEIQAQVAALGGSEADVDVNDGGSIEGVSGDLMGLSSLLIGLVPLAGPVGAALAAAFIGAGAAAGALVGAVGVLALGISGVSKTMGLLDQKQKAVTVSGGGAVGSMNAQAGAAAQLASAEAALKNARAQAANAAITSAEQVKQAEQSLDDTLSAAFNAEIADRQAVKQAIRDVATAARQAAQQQAQDAQSVVDAEHNLAEAARSSANAQQQLNDAREQAARDLESYANNAVDSNLNLQQSQIDLTNAQNQYQSDLTNPSVTPLQLQQDALNVAKAQQAIVEAQERLAQATEDNNKAQAEGIANAPGVLSAQQNLADALYAQQQAAQALGDAQTKQAQDAVAGDAAINKAEAALDAARLTRAQNEEARAEGLAAAEQKVTDALRAQANQKRQSDYSVSSAQAGVASAHRAVAGAGASGGGGGSSELANINAQLAKVNPATLAFAHFVQNVLEPALNKLKDAAAGGLLPGVEKGFEAFLPILPSLTKFVGSLAKTMGDLFAQGAKALGSPFWLSFFGYVSQSAGPILTTFAKIIGNLAKGFAGLMQAFGPVTTAIGQGLLSLTRSFANFGAGKTGTLQTFLAFVQKEGPPVAEMFGNLAVLIGHLVVALAPLGAVMVTVIGGVVSALDKLSSGQLLGLIAAISAAVLALAASFTAVTAPVSLTAAGIVAAAGLIAANWSKVGPIIRPIIDAFRVGLKTAIDLVTGAIDSHRAQLDRLVHDLAPFIVILKLVAQVIGVILKGAFDLIGISFALTIDLLGEMTRTFTPLQRAARAVAAWFSDTFAPSLVGAFRTVKSDTVSTFDNIVSFIEGLPKKIAKAAVGMWDGIRDAFRSAIDWIIEQWDRLHFTITIPSIKIGPLKIGGGSFTLGLPYIQPLATGGMTDGPALKLLGDNPGGREVALPLGSQQTTDALAVALGKALDSRPTPVTAFDSGGWLPMGLSAVWNGTGAPEPVFTPGQLAALATRSQVAFPDQVTLVDQDGSILAHARVVAHGAITDRAFAAQQDQRARRPGTTADLLVKNGPR